MTETAARTWLSSYHDIIPALEVHHAQALEILEDHTKTLRDLAEVIVLDPGMSVSLYHEVNNKLVQGNKQSVDSVHAALSLLGDGKIADLVMQHKVLGETHPDALRRQSYHQLMSRTFHLLAQLESFVSIQGIRGINEIRSAAILHNIGEFCACLFDHERYQRYQQKFRELGIDANSAKQVFSFDFHELGRIYAEKSYLPMLVTESLDENIPAGRKARLIQLAADVSHQAEVSWYHSAMKATEEVCAAYLNQSLEGFDRQIQRIALDCARNSPFDDVIPAAARLIMLPDLEQAPKPALKLELKADPGGQEFEHRIKALLRTQNPTQAQLLDLLLGHLHDDLHLTRVALLLMSRDGNMLGTRAGKGFDEHSPIRTLVIDISSASVLRSLMSKSQALWVESDTYSNYEAALPAKFKSAFLHESFYLMSMHVNGRPTGLIYADRSLGVHKLDKVTYIKFKSAILLTSKAVTYLGKMKQQTAS